MMFISLTIFFFDFRYYFYIMKKFLVFLVLLFCLLNVYSNNLDLKSVKDVSEYDKCIIIGFMNKYHTKYGKNKINYIGVYATIKYWSNYYDIDLAFALTFFAIESGFTYECKSRIGASGMGQLTTSALKDFNDWYGKNISILDLNDKNKYDINIMVSLGYIRMCWDRYKIIENGEDLIKSYNIGVGNLRKIKNGEYSSDNFWTISANKYSDKFNEVYSDFVKCRR